MKLDLKRPESVKTDADFLAHAYAAGEKLRLDYNAHGTEFREGRLGKAAWDAYRDEDHEPKMAAIARAVCEARKRLADAGLAAIDLKTAFSEQV